MPGYDLRPRVKEVCHLADGVGQPATLLDPLAGGLAGEAQVGSLKMSEMCHHHCISPTKNASYFKNDTFPKKTVIIPLGASSEQYCMASARLLTRRMPAGRWGGGNGGE